MVNNPDRHPTRNPAKLIHGYATLCQLILSLLTTLLFLCESAQDRCQGCFMHVKYRNELFSTCFLRITVLQVDVVNNI